MFEKMKEYGLYLVLGLIAMGALAYSYVQTSNQSKGAAAHQANIDAIVANISKSDKQKKSTTIAETMLEVNGGRTVGQYRIDSEKISYVIGETYDDIFDNKRTIDISSDLNDIGDGKLRIILIAQPATQVNGEDIDVVELNKDRSIKIGETTYTQENLKGIDNELKGYNISAMGFGVFENEQSAKDFRDNYFANYEIYEVGTTGKFILLTEYNTVGGGTITNKINSSTNGETSGGGGSSSTENEYFSLASNGITVQAKEGTVCGEEYEFNGNTYYVACNKNDVYSKIIDEGYQANRVVTTKVTDMSFLFSEGTSRSEGRFYGYTFISPDNFNEDISNWDTSNVTSMYCMFCGNGNFNQPIGNWNVSHVTDMSYMFAGANAFNQPIGNWDVSHVTDMSRMFSGNFDGDSRQNTFNQDISNWDVSHVTNMYGMFNYNVAFNQNLSGWNVSNVDASILLHGIQVPYDDRWNDFGGSEDRACGCRPGKLLGGGYDEDGEFLFGFGFASSCTTGWSPCRS